MKTYQRIWGDFPQEPELAAVEERHRKARCTMSRRIYYLVQTSPTLFVHKSGALGFVEGFGAAEAAQLQISEARRLYREFCAAAPDGDVPRGFPRILKVTTEMRTITAPNRKGER